MIDADLFDEFVKLAKRGRRLDRAGLDPRVVAELDRYLGRGRAAVAAASKALPTLPPIYADFVTNPQFNAFAFKHRERYFIAFHDGLPLVLLMVLYRLLADRRVFRHVGEPDQEAESLPPFQLVFPDAAQLATANLGAVVPKHAWRQIYAIHLSHLAFDFLTVHEIAHLAHGHVDYLRAEHGLPYVSELEWLPNTPEGNLESQAMELDADSSAARMIVHTARANVAQRDTLPTDIAGLYWDPVQAMFDVAVAVCVIFRLFQDSRLQGVDLLGRSHPPRRWRQMQILNMLGNYVDQNWDNSLVPAVESALSRALGEVEEAFELITGTGQQVHGLHDAWHGDGWKYTAAVSASWNNTVRPKVAKYSFVAPNTYDFAQPSNSPKWQDSTTGDW